MATVTNYPIDLPILVIEAQIFVAVKKFPFLPNKLIPNTGQGSSGVIKWCKRNSLQSDSTNGVRHMLERVIGWTY